MRCATAVALSIVLVLLASTPRLTAQVGSMRVTVPSPTAASLGKFGDIPVSLYSGVPSISIPLFVAKGKTLELPIVLEYHAGGIRVEEIGGWGGIGWTLEAGGAITRTVRGIADEEWNGYFNTGHAFYAPANWPTPSAAILQSMSDEQVDGEPDQFFFSFAGRSGQIVMGPIDAAGTKDYRVIPYAKWRVQPTFGEGLASWTITTEDGTVYVFAARELSADYTFTQSGNNPPPIPPNWGRTHASSWHLTEIHAPGGDAIYLGYAGYTARHRQGNYIEKFDQVVSLGEPCRPDQFSMFGEYETSGVQLASITTASHTIEFSVALREDARSPGGAAQEYRLAQITVKTPAGTVLRMFGFEHDYSIGGRLTLKNVYEQDRNGVALPPYSFTYDPVQLPPLTSFAQDHWGYFNGQTSNTTFIPATITQHGTVLSGADRSPNPAFMKAGSLTRITYPTGGYNEFVYEANDYGALGPSGAVPVGEGPLQTVSISSWETPSTTFTIGGVKRVIVKVFTQQSPGDCGVEINPPCPYTEIVGVAGWNDSYAIHEVSLLPGTYTLRADDKGLYPDGWAMIEISWRDFLEQPKKIAGGLRVAEVRAADAMGNVTVRKYRYTLPSDPNRSSGTMGAEPSYAYYFESNVCSYFSRSTTSKIPLGGGPVVGYSDVTVLHGANGEFGRSRTTFRAGGDPPPDGVWPYLRRTTYEWKRGQQTETTESNAAGAVQQRVAATYAFRDEDGEPITTRAFRGLSLYFLSVGSGGSFDQPVGVYLYNPFSVISAWTYQNSETTTAFDTTGTSSFSTTKTFVYGNPAHVQLTQVTETNSDGTERITRMRYPADYAAGSGNAEAAALSAMQGAAHMHSALVERAVIQRNGAVEKIMQSELTTYKLYAPGQYRPYQRFVLNSPSPLQ